MSAVELRSYLKEALPDYMVPAVWVEVQAMPLTPSGKTDRRQLPLPQERRPELETGYVPPSNETERKLAGIWQDVLGVNRVGINDNFFTLGGHSIMATQLASWIRESLGTEISLKAIFENPTIVEMSRYLEQQSHPSAYGEPSEKLEAFNDANVDDLDADYPLSFAQQRLWFLNHFMEDKAAYNIPGALRFKGALDIQALRNSLNEIIKRHKALRSAFHESNGIPFVETRESVWLELEPLPCPFAYEDRESAIQRLAAEEAGRPFDLSRDPLVRAALFRFEREDHLFLVTMHHIVSDGWSLSIFTQELSKLYNAYLHNKTSPLPPLKYQYSHYARWQRRYSAGPQWTSQLNYWKKKLQDLKPVLMLPADFPRPEQQRFRGSVQRFRLDAGLLESLRVLGRSEGATLFMTLLAAFNILLGRYTNEDDIAVGTPIANRNRKEIEPIIGFFANTLVLRTDLSGTPDFSQMLRKVRESCLEAYDNQDVPFEKLVEILQPVRNPMFSPLFQVMFILQNNELPIVGLDHIFTEPVQYDQGIAKFDLTLTFEETASGLEGNFEYNTDLFHPDTIIRMVSHFQALLQAVTEHPDWNVHTLPIPQKEKPQTCRQPLYEKTQTTAEGFIQLFEEQVNRTPDSAAIVYEGQTVSYSELNERSDRWAVRLQKEEIGEGSPVGLFMEKSPDFAVSFLGILKSGAFCVPIDAECSTERINLIAEDSGMQLILTQQHLKEKLTSFPGQIIAIDDAEITRTDCDMEDSLEFKPSLKPEQTACLMYASDSGSVLQGVIVRHYSLTVQAKRMEGLLMKELTEKPLRAGWTGSAQSEILLMQMQYLLYGHTLYPVRQAIRTESAEMLTFARKHEIEVFACTPPQLRMLIGEGLILQYPTALKTIWVIGELLDQALWIRLAKSGHIRFYQIFGMLEQGGAALGCRLADHDEPCLGQPLFGVELAVLNRHKQPVPLGAPGELYFPKPSPMPMYWKDAAVHNAETNSVQAEWFSTGVWVRRLPDGSIRYIGTIDYDAESEGFRMEKESVEAVLYRHPAVRQVCLKKIDASPVPVLAVYLSVDQEGVTASEMKEYMHMRLPGHLIPQYLVLLDSLPLTHSGQYDMASLPKPDITSKADESIAEPRNAIDDFILKYWRELLGVPDMGIHDHFFEWGGHSLLAMEVISQVREEFGVQLSVKTLFDSPTVARLSNEIERLLIEEIEDMDEEEARLLLEAE
ncbi:Linear gramicidin synthase subunit D [compost metagenome]